MSDWRCLLAWRYCPRREENRPCRRNRSLWRRRPCRRGAARLRGFWRRPACLQPGAPRIRNIFPPHRVTIGAGQVKAGLILPLSAPGNAGVAGQAMRNAAEMAIAEFKEPNVQLLLKDDGGTAEAARLGAQQAIDEGAEIVLGPLFAQSVTYVGQVARARNIPVIAFSTDANVAASGVYLLSFLPESDVERIVQYAAATGKHSFAALIPDNAYGAVVEASLKQAVARHNGQIIALEH